MASAKDVASSALPEGDSQAQMMISFVFCFAFHCHISMQVEGLAEKLVGCSLLFGLTTLALELHTVSNAFQHPSRWADFGHGFARHHSRQPAS